MSNENYQFYCLSFNNPTRKESMIRRFETIKINCIFYQGVDKSHPRIAGRDNTRTGCWSCMYGHLDMINDFYYNTDKQYGIFCEDDIFIRKDIKTLLPKIIEEFNINKLDVLLLGHLFPFELNLNNIKHDGYIFCRYTDDIWGAQMYMLSRNQAKVLLDKYSFSSGYADKSLYDNTLTPFSADFTLTKDGNRALVYPLLAIEDNKTKYDDPGQQYARDICFSNNFVKGLFIE